MNTTFRPIKVALLNLGSTHGRRENDPRRCGTTRSGRKAGIPELDIDSATSAEWEPGDDSRIVLRLAPGPTVTRELDGRASNGWMDTFFRLPR